MAWMPYAYSAWMLYVVDYWLQSLLVSEFNLLHKQITFVPRALVLSSV